MHALILGVEMQLFSTLNKKQLRVCKVVYSDLGWFWSTNINSLGLV